MNNRHIITMLPKTYSSIILLLSIRLVVGQFRFDSGRPPTSSNEFGSLFANSSASGLIWQPLRATFRPLNRATPPTPPAPPTPPTPAPDFSAFGANVRDFSFDLPSAPINPPIRRQQPAPTQPSSAVGAGLSSFFATDRALTAAAATISTTLATTPAPASNLDDDDLPTRVPLNRFRPTKPPSVDPQSQPGSASVFISAANSGSHNANGNQQQHHNNSIYRITNDCFECICEASTSCNPNSRCQTSDVRHTRCGMMLISYAQWLETGLSRELVSREALARDAAADERAFYECVTDRNCAERALALYMQRNAKDCDKDGRVDCYDVAAIHQGGTDRCSSEALLESQYWSDFSACFGFGR